MTFIIVSVNVIKREIDLSKKDIDHFNNSKLEIQETGAEADDINQSILILFKTMEYYIYRKSIGYDKILILRPEYLSLFFRHLEYFQERGDKNLKEMWGLTYNHIKEIFSQTKKKFVNYEKIKKDEKSGEIVEIVRAYKERSYLTQCRINAIKTIEGPNIKEEYMQSIVSYLKDEQIKLEDKIFLLNIFLPGTISKNAPPEGIINNLRSKEVLDTIQYKVETDEFTVLINNMSFSLTDMALKPQLSSSMTQNLDNAHSDAEKNTSNASNTNISNTNISNTNISNTNISNTNISTSLSKDPNNNIQNSNTNKKSFKYIILSGIIIPIIWVSSKLINFHKREEGASQIELENADIEDTM
jgi:hypothetical protein